MPTDRRRRGERTDDEDRHQEREESHHEPRANPSSRTRGRRTSHQLTAQAAAETGLRLMREMTAKDPEGVTSVAPAEDGWTVEVEVVEDRRIPSSADVLALYEVQIDTEGSLKSYRRTRRYTRGRGNSGEVR